MISPSSTNPKVTQSRRLHLPHVLHRPVPGHGDGASFAAENLELKKVAILKDVKNDYSVGLAAVLHRGVHRARRRDRRRAGLQRRATRTSAPSSPRSRRSNPEAIFVPGYYTEVGLIARQARELGHHGAAARRRRLGERPADRDRRRGARTAATTRTTSRSTIPTRALQDFLTRYKAKFDADPDAIGGLAYDAANVLFRSLEKLHAAGSRGVHGARRRPRPARRRARRPRQKLRDLIAATTNYPGVTGTITLDENRNAVEAGGRDRDQGRQEGLQHARSSPDRAARRAPTACPSSSSSSSTA